MFKTLREAWKVPDIRKKMIFTALVVLLFRFGCAVPIPFINIGAEGLLKQTTTATFLDYINMISGNAFNYGTIFAMSITPYINASIIIELLTVAIPALERLAKEGEEGRKKISQITRIVGVVLALLQGSAYFVYLNSQKALVYGASASTPTRVFQALVIIFILTCGAALTMWLGEEINDKGIGNGISILLFAGIVSRIPSYATQFYEYFQYGGIFYALVPLAIVFLILLVIFIVWMDNAERRIPVQYTKRVVGRKMYGGQSSNIPIKVNMSGVLPIIFASSILSIPSTVQMFVTPKANSFWGKFFNVFTTEHWAYGLIYFVLIIFFAYFYASIQYNPIEMANNLAKNSGTIPGIRSGRPTSDYIARVLSKMILLGALLLSVVALFPILFSQSTSLLCKALGKQSGMSISLGGTSIIILVGVALETVQQLKSQMMMRHYKGFLD